MRNAMLQVIDEARDRLNALGREAAKRVDDGASYIDGLKREASRRADDGASYLGDLTREVSRRADDGARYAYEKAKSDRVSWTVVAGALGVGFITAFALLNSKRAAVVTTTAMTGDWFEVLSADRKRIERLFKQIEMTNDDQAHRRTRLLESLSAALTRYALQKENVIYPALREGDKGAASTHLAAELFEIKTYLYELDRLPKSDGRWLRKLKALQHVVEEHMREEEQTVLPAFHKRLSEAENLSLTRAMNREAMKLA
jgi:hemerythrin superfamily protein